MVNPPLYTVLLVGNRHTGKTTYIQRLMGIEFDEIAERQRIYFQTTPREPDPICTYYIPIPNSEDVVRVLELNHVLGGYTPIPNEYMALIHKIIVFASFDDEYSIYDITFHANTYHFLGAPIHVLVNKKDLLQNASPNVANAVLASGALSSVHLISCKSDGNLFNPFI